MAEETSEERAGLSGPGRVAAIVALVGAVVLLFLFLFTGSGVEYHVKARFQSAGQLVNGNLVQHAGRGVGLVKKIDLADDGTAEVTLKIDEELAPLRRGTRATIRMASLSGVANRYVDLELPPGESQEKIPDGGLIALQDTTTVVDLDHLFSLFDEKTRKGLKNVIRGFGASYEGKAREANAGWEYMNPSLVATRKLFEELSYDQRALESFVISNAKLVSDISERRDDVAKLVDRLATTFNAIAVEKGSLQQAVAALPPFMRRANTTFINLRATLDDLDPLIDESRPVTPKLRAVLAELRPFAKDATPTFRDLAALVKKKGEHNDLIELANSIFDFRDVTTKPGTYNGATREGAFAAAVRSLKGQTPQWAFQRPYTVDFTGWFDDFSHSGIYDAFGSASRVSTNTSALAFLNGALVLVPENIRGQVFSEVAALNQRNRCPGSTERPAPDKSNPFKPSPDYNCDETQVPPGS